MPEKRPQFGVIDDGDMCEGYLSKPPVEWLDAELEAGRAQITARAGRHPEYAAELAKLAQQLTDEQARRRLLYADVAAVFFASPTE